MMLDKELDVVKGSFLERACTLCKAPLRTAVPGEKGAVYCCFGCKTVHQILQACHEDKNDVTDHPLYQNALKQGFISGGRASAWKETIPQNGSESATILWAEIEHMWCLSCADLIHLASQHKKGIFSCRVDYATDLARIEYDPKVVSQSDLIKWIDSLGYHLILLDDLESKNETSSLRLRSILAAFFSLNIMMLSYPVYALLESSDTLWLRHMFAWISFCLCLPTIFYCGLPLFRKALLCIRLGIWSMEVLALLSVVSAFLFSTMELLQGSGHIYFDSIALIIWLMLAGRSIEQRIKNKAKAGVGILFKNLPKRGRKRGDSGELEFVDIKQMKKGDIIETYLGEKVVLDGIVLSGQALVDESFLTGEALPLLKKEGDQVLAGSMIQQGGLVIEVKAERENTFLRNVIASIESNWEEKKSLSYPLDNLLKVFIPSIILLALATFLICTFIGKSDQGISPFETGWRRMLCVLLISCPCAIGIAQPIVESSLVACLAASGILIRNRKCLNQIGKSSCYVFDKTGTLTRGVFQVLDGISGLDPFFSRVLKGLSSRSSHPVSVAINQSIACTPYVLEEIQEWPGMGITGMWQGIRYFLGSSKLIQVATNIEKGALKEIVDKEEGVISTVWFTSLKEVITQVHLGDSLREDALNTVQSLQSLGYRIVLLSGDKKSTVESVARQLKINEWKAEMLPQDKKDWIRELKKEEKGVIMVGDGINDAPALALADMGISLRSATDLSIQSADLCLMHDQLNGLITAQELGKKARSIVQQNIFWAFSYNIVGIILAVQGALSPVFSAAAMVVSSCLVVANGARLAPRKENSISLRR